MLAAFCENCFTFQLLMSKAPEKMFNENYAYLINFKRCSTVQLFQTICKESKVRVFYCGNGSNDDFSKKHC